LAKKIFFRTKINPHRIYIIIIYEPQGDQPAADGFALLQEKYHEMRENEGLFNPK
jgi:hypothetical protein